MAFNFTVDPDLAAKVTYEGIMAGAKGFSQGIDKFGQGLAKGLEKQKDDAKMFKSLQEYADSAGIASKDQTTPMDLDSLKGLVEGTVAKRVNTEALQRLQMNDQLQKYRALQMQGMQQGIDAPDQDRRLYDELSQIGQPPLPSRAATVGRVDETGATIPGSLSPAPPGLAAAAASQNQNLYNPQAIMGAIKRSGWAGQPEKIDNFIQRLQSMSPQSNVPVKHDLGNGYVGYTLPGSKILDVRPDLTQAPNVQAQPITDDDGNVLGHAVPNGRGGFQFIKPKKGPVSAELLPATDPVKGTVIPGFYVNPDNGKTVDTRSSAFKATGHELDRGATTNSNRSLVDTVKGYFGGAPKTNATPVKAAMGESPDDDVKVVAPNGKVGTVKRKDLKAALAKGLRVVE